MNHLKQATLISVYLIITLMAVICISPVKALERTNTPATIILGQEGYTGLCNSTPNSGDKLRGIRNPSGVYLYNGRLFVSDKNANRLLIYNSIPNFAAPNVVLGQNSFQTCDINPTTATSLYQPSAVIAKRIGSTDKLLISDTVNNRILVYNNLPISSNSIPSFVIGQPDMTTSTQNTGGISSKSLRLPVGLYADDDRLAIADAYNNRVLIYSPFPTESPMVNNSTQGASVVIGQADMISGSANRGNTNVPTALSLYSPRDVKIYIDPASVLPDGSFNDTPSDKTRLFISDTSNNRILIWNTIPTVSDQPADVVIGQQTKDTRLANNNYGTTGITDKSLSAPFGMYTDGTKLIVTDYLNNRVLIYNSIPTQDYESANIVIGQPDMNSNAANNDNGISARTLNQPINVFSDGTKLIISDYLNNRVLIYNNIPTYNFAPADIVIGQPNMNSGAPFGAVTHSNTLYTPIDLASDGTNLLITDADNGRVIGFNQAPTYSNASADFVIGQPNLTSGIHNNGGISAHSLYYPNSANLTQGKLLVGDYANDRILLFDHLPTSNNHDADYVIGQKSFTVNDSYPSIISDKSLHRAQTMDLIDNNLFVADTWNNRVLMFDITNVSNVPVGDSLAATAVLGQSSFTTNTGNYNGLSDKSIYFPRGVKVVDMGSEGKKLIVSDTINNRILLYDFPITTYKAASYVIGQPNFTSNAANNGGIGPSTFYNQTQIYTDGTRLFVADYENSRVLIFNSIPKSNVPADVVIGQPDFTSRTVNNGGVSARSLNKPYSMRTVGNYLYVADTQNHRVLGYPLGPQNIQVTAPTSVSELDTAIEITADGAKEMKISTDASFSGTEWESFTQIKTVTLNAVESPQNYYIKMRDYANYESETVTRTIAYDKTSPICHLTINNNAQQTNSVNVNLVFSCSDTNNVKSLLIANNQDFTGTSWGNYLQSLSWSLSKGDGIKTIYAKAKDDAGNISDIFSAQIILDTTPPVIRITTLGLIDNLPDKESLFYYFTSQSPRIKGISEPSCKIIFNYNSNTYTTNTDEKGNFDIIIPGLPRQLVNLNYYAQDLAGNLSNKKFLKLLIGIENFPKSTGVNSELIPIVTVTPKTNPTDEPLPVIPSIIAITITNNLDKTLSNVKIFINGQEYVSDKDGKIYVERELTSKDDIKGEIGGKLIVGRKDSNRIVFESALITTRSSIFSYCVGVTILLMSVIVLILLRNRKKKVSKELHSHQFPA